MTPRTTSVDIGSERAFAVLIVVVSLVVLVAVLASERSGSEENEPSRDSAPEERSESKQEFLVTASIVRIRYRRRDTDTHTRRCRPGRATVSTSMPSALSMRTKEDV
jgi:hypothetical protein